MSFTFNWPRFSDQFHYDAIQMLNNALNKGNKPPVIADKIEVVELEMGTKPPDLEVREIGELTVDQFRGIFRLSYDGDAHIVLKTKVQANPLNHKQPDIHIMAGTKGMLAARQPLVVPMLLRLSHFKLRSIIVLVVSKQKGITLVFKTDPLQNVDINSTFDSIAVIQKFIQREIEGQLRQMFREDLPGIIHRLSQQWIKAKVEAPYISKRPSAPPAPPAPSPILNSSPIPAPLSFDNVAGLSSHHTMPYTRVPHSTRASSVHRSRSTYSGVTGTTRRPVTRKNTTPPSPPDDMQSTFPDLENYDPTYGLRPEGLPTKSVFKGFQNLFTPNRGLADLTEDPSEPDTDSEPPYDHEHEDSTTYDMVDWDGVPGLASPGSQSDFTYTPEDHGMEYETIPAVGGGSVIRPRVVHSQSMIQDAAPQSPSPASRRMGRRPTDSAFSPLRAGMVLSPSSARLPGYNPYFSDSATGLASASSSKSVNSAFSLRSAPPFLPRPHFGRSITPDSLETPPSYSTEDNTQSLLTPPEKDSVPISFTASPSPSRRPSVSSNPNNFFPSSPTNHNTLYDMEDETPKIVLRPSPLNNTLHQLSTLSHSNHTLSPYTRSLEHFTVRSVPPRYAGGNFGPSSSIDRQPVKAKRKRTYHLGGQKANSSMSLPLPSQVPSGPSDDRNLYPPAMEPNGVPESDIDVSDMDRYFPVNDVDQKNQNSLPPSSGVGLDPFSPPNIHPHHFRLRSSYVHPE
ncbi:uncharacterized protein C8R40DRAFT_1169509 [Lentinula edodes]|uniref:uncharacterized protein n=1 Tax=Lentinula edodes TaxID=5353 RepID=UPI001E8DD066|nr:uncharacterized protein C8R40DRAFT_1169509 [Lentinula edodes]KAH7876388.1 hypothetical protein C8R40DRAFT_1169509 [Lentinula edodes]